MLLTYYYIWNFKESKGVKYITNSSVVLTENSWMIENYVTKEEAQDVINKYDLQGFEIIE